MYQVKTCIIHKSGLVNSYKKICILNYIFQVSDSAQSRQDTSQGQTGKSQGQPKKIERKVASVGPNRHVQNKGKNAWK